MVTVEVLDAQGRVVPTATNLINFTVSGGNIIGVGNGDPSSHEADKASQRSVFNGLAEVIVQSTDPAWHHHSDRDFRWFDSRPISPY